MTDQYEIRNRALQVLGDCEKQSYTAVHNAIVDLRRNPVPGDDRILWPFLAHDDSMVVAVALYTLFRIHEQHDVLRSIVKRIARQGDERERDDLDRPIQSTAIVLLGDSAKEDESIALELLEIAEANSTPDTPRERAWQLLADLHGVKWPSHATEEMILRPDSEVSEQIRADVRRAMASKSGED
ncbi:hypothetical protein Pan216_13070 [Planctomycetes bacterium Pan216]|uniref:HEAT repeat protein n=1 Tax=Kolteria novifilia TaxID=2527975 RepID=A0A518B0G6_9BACT|nr:hypothetical protein Pan216_13070 [Planctomycetes bacterium Pan216]